MTGNEEVEELRTMVHQVVVDATGNDRQCGLGKIVSQQLNIQQTISNKQVFDR